MRHFPALLAAPLFAALFAPSAFAAVAVAYDADGACPSADAFIAAATQRAGGIALEPAKGPATEATVVLRKTADGFSGRLDLRRASGDYIREMNAASCDELALALAFVLGLAVVEQYGKKDEPPATPPPAPPSPAPPPPAAPSLDAWFGAAIGVRTGIAPDAPLTEAMFAQARLTAAPRTSFGLGVTHAERSGTGPGYSWDLSWTAARVEACPASLERRYVRIAPCAGLNAGVIQASGRAAVGRSETRGWAEALAALELDLRVAEPVFLRLDAEALVPFSRYDFSFTNPETPVYSMPRIASAGSVGIAFRIR